MCDINTKYTFLGDYCLVISMYKKGGVYLFGGYLLKENVIIDKCITQGITDNLERAKYIFDVLFKERVLPIHFHYIIDELISEYE